MSPEQISWLFLAIIAAIPIVLLILWLKARARASSTGAELIDLKLNASKLGTEKAKLIEALEGLERRFRPVIDADEELANVKEQHRAAMAELETLRNDYTSKKEIYDRLRHEVAIFDEQLSFAELGIYEPHFEFGDSETYKHSIKAAREAQKAMNKKKNAVVCQKH
jgi:chromosome segregation ATPase